MTSAHTGSDLPKDAKSFMFPYDAYQIQIDFMNALYDTIEHRQVGLFESPTGTGKSLSLLCGSMKWLRDHQDAPLVLDEELQERKPEAASTTSAKTLPWVLEFQRQKAEENNNWKKKEHKRIQEKYQEKLRKLRLSTDEPNVSLEPAPKRTKRAPVSVPPSSVSNAADSASSEDFLLADYESDPENSIAKDDLDDFLEARTKKPMHGLEMTADEKELEEYPVRKIFFCSRTHSQLSQFIEEVRKTHWSNDLRLVVLGSRKNLCINSAVNKLPTMNQINDKCLDLIKAKETIAISAPSPYLPSTSTSGMTFGDSSSSLSPMSFEHNPVFGIIPEEVQATMCKFFHQQRQAIFRDHILSSLRDIEELVAMGQDGVECPYFATRAAVKNAELVVLPYNTLLHKSTREALGIDLRGSIVILDEAHNLIDTVNAIHCVELTFAKTSQALSQLEQYLDKYCKRLKPKHVSYIEKILAILRNLIKYMTPDQDANTTLSGSDANDHGVSAHIVQLNDFLFDAKLDVYNMFQLEKYMTESDLIHKVQGFATASQVEILELKRQRTITIQLSESEFEKHRPALGLVAQFLGTLTSRGADACLLVTTHPTDHKLSSLKYILLNPETHFQAVLREARAVIMAGGTMQPFGDFALHLLSASSTDPKLSPSRIQTFSYSHIIPSSNLTTVIFASGPTGVEFSFSYENRQKYLTDGFDELARLVTNLCNIVPDGVVMFSPSYHFEEALITRWTKTGDIERIKAKKAVFREPRGSSSVDAVLAEYEAAISKNTGLPGCPNGALLSCVVGGKLSEGINFKDHLGRLVLVLGLPYPNAKDPILVERLAHINHKTKNVSTPSGAASSSEYYENLCMKAVNQSIGRSIRHIGDYASIVLVDKRYQKPSIQAKLPEWIRKRLVPTKDFGEGFREVVAFFRTKKEDQQRICETRRES